MCTDLLFENSPHDLRCGLGRYSWRAELSRTPCDGPAGVPRPGAMVGVDWSRFGLSAEPAGRPSAAAPSAADPLAGSAQQQDELFAEEQVGSHGLPVFTVKDAGRDIGTGGKSR